jgi:hypothetical protein
VRPAHGAAGGGAGRGVKPRDRPAQHRPPGAACGRGAQLKSHARGNTVITSGCSLELCWQQRRSYPSRQIASRPQLRRHATSGQMLAAATRACAGSPPAFRAGQLGWGPVHRGPCTRRPSFPWCRHQMGRLPPPPSCTAPDAWGWTRKLIYKLLCRPTCNGRGRMGVVRQQQQRRQQQPRRGSSRRRACTPAAARAAQRPWVASPCPPPPAWMS